MRDHLLQRIDGAERIRDMADGDDLGLAAPSSFSNSSSNQLALLIDRRNPQLRALLLAQHLPRNDVGVVLHRRDQHFVTRADMRPAIGLRHEVDGFGRAAHKDDLARHARHAETLALTCALLRIPPSRAPKDSARRDEYWRSRARSSGRSRRSPLSASATVAALSR